MNPSPQKADPGMTSLRQQIAGRLREALMRRWGIAYSRHGTQPLVLKALMAREPIVLIDVGASDGAFAASLEREYGFKRALLIEPQPARVKQLRTMFSGPNVVILETALAEQEGQRTMEVLNWDYSSSLLPVDRSRSSVLERIDLSVRETITVPVSTLDDQCRTFALDSVDLLKLDVQGAELMVLRGAEETLRRTRFVLSEVSFRPYYVGGATFEQIFSHMREKGFRLLGLTEGFRDSSGELVEADALFGR
jgi:FkbM family methyltransferase